MTSFTDSQYYFYHLYLIPILKNILISSVDQLEVISLILILISDYVLGGIYTKNVPIVEINLKYVILNQGNNKVLTLNFVCLFLLLFLCNSIEHTNNLDFNFMNTADDQITK